MAGKKPIPTDPNALLAFIAGYVQEMDHEIRMLRKDVGNLAKEIKNLAEKK